MQENRQTEEGRRLVTFLSNTAPGNVEIPRTDTSAVKKMTVIQVAQPGIDRIDIREVVCQMVTDLLSSVQSNDESEGKSYCEDKFRPLNEGELQRLVEANEQSFAKMLGETCVGSGIDEKGVHADVAGVQEKKSGAVVFDTSKVFQWDKLGPRGTPH